MIGRKFYVSYPSKVHCSNYKKIKELIQINCKNTGKLVLISFTILLGYRVKKFTDSENGVKKVM